MPIKPWPVKGRLPGESCGGTHCCRLPRRTSAWSGCQLARPGTGSLEGDDGIGPEAGTGNTAGRFEAMQTLGRIGVFWIGLPGERQNPRYDVATSDPLCAKWRTCTDIALCPKTG